MRRSCPGFTLVELLVVASIMIIVFVVGIASYTQFNRGQILNQAVLELKNSLRLAQNMASSGEKPSPNPCDSLEGYRVTFIAGANDSYQIQAQCSNGLGTPKTFSLPSAVRFVLILLPLPPHPPPPILFKVTGKGSGVDGWGEISLTSFGVTKKVTVTLTGEIK